jgi:HEAT repeats
MGKKRRILLAALLVVLLSGFGWWLLRPSEPSYKGKPLSEWLEEAEGTNSMEAEDALQHIGTNAIPSLLRMLQANDSPFKLKCIALLGRQNLINIEISNAKDKNLEASVGFKSLGSNAAGATSELVEIFKAPVSGFSQIITADVIGDIGPTATNAIPSLVQGLKAKNAMVRRESALALGRIHGNAAEVVPEMVKLLHDPEPFVRQCAAIVLGEFGTNGTAAVPTLVAKLEDPSEYVRDAATNALKQIDPAAAAKAGIK